MNNRPRVRRFDARSRDLPCLISLVALSFSACAMPVDDVASDDDGEVASQVEALGQPLDVRSVNALGLFDLGPSIAVYATTENCASRVDLLNLSNASIVSLGSLPNCGRVSAAASDNAVFVVDTTADDVILWDILEGRTKLADTNGNIRGKLLLDATHVYWSDDSGIRKVPRSGGAVTAVKNSASPLHLLGIEGAVIYFKAGADLRRISTSGVGETTLHTDVDAEFGGFSFDANQFYWTTNLQPVHRLVRLPKAGAVESIPIRADGDVIFGHPVSSGSNLYWRESGNGFAGAIFRLTSAGVISPQLAVGTPFDGMRIRQGFLYWDEFQLLAGGGALHRVKRAGLP